MYKTFMKHAEKVTKSPAAKTRPMLGGVKHYRSGSLAVTDSHRLYYAKDMHDKGDCLLSPSGSEINETYPEISRLMPQDDPKEELTFTVDELIQATDIMLTASKAANSFPVMEYAGDHLLFNNDIDIQASYQLSQSTSFEFLSSSQYWLDALKLFKAMEYKEVNLNIYDQHRPFTFTSKDENLTALILPMRRY